MSLTKRERAAHRLPASRTDTADASQSVSGHGPKKASMVAVLSSDGGQRRGLHEGRPREVRREAVVGRAAEHDGDRGDEPALATQLVDPVERGAQHPPAVVPPPERRESAEQAGPRLERVGVVEPRATETAGAERARRQEADDEQPEEAEARVLVGDQLDPGEGAEPQRRPATSPER